MAALLRVRVVDRLLLAVVFTINFIGPHILGPY